MSYDSGWVKVLKIERERLIMAKVLLAWMLNHILLNTYFLRFWLNLLHSEWPKLHGFGCSECNRVKVCQDKWVFVVLKVYSCT